MSDPESKRVMLTIADGYRRVAERTEARQPKKRMDGISFGPAALKAIGAAFEATWRDIANNFRNEATEIETARLKLATALLSIATDESRNIEVLKRAALQRMALYYRGR